MPEWVELPWLPLPAPPLHWLLLFCWAELEEMTPPLTRPVPSSVYHNSRVNWMSNFSKVSWTCYSEKIVVCHFVKLQGEQKKSASNEIETKKYMIQSGIKVTTRHLRQIITDIPFLSTLYKRSYLSRLHYGMNTKVDDIIQSNFLVSIHNLKGFGDSITIDDTGRICHVGSYNQLYACIWDYIAEQLGHLPWFRGKLTSTLMGILGLALTWLRTW